MSTEQNLSSAVCLCFTAHEVLASENIAKPRSFPEDSVNEPPLQTDSTDWRLAMEPAYPGLVPIFRIWLSLGLKAFSTLRYNCRLLYFLPPAVRSAGSGIKNHSGQF